jgi:hypothetical protein
MLYLWFKKPASLDIDTENKIFCYWISSGTWGAYTPPNKIFICPWEINKAGGLKRVIEHELTHLKYEKDVRQKKLSHEEKEEFINKIK